MKPLNDMLYQALLAKFRAVRVTHEGEQATVIYSPDWHRKDRLRAELINAGEYYCVSCCYCTDTRQRLWINHRWGVYDPKTGDNNLHLAICYNENCLNSRARQRDLQLRLMIPGPMRVRPKRTNDTTPPPKTFTLPEGIVPVNQLGDGHPAAAYLRGRGFDLNELASRYQVCYCEYEPTEPPLLRRIVIPIYRPRMLVTAKGASLDQGNVLAGWIARTIGADEPKYLACTGMAKSYLLYNLSAAKSSTGPVVVCEGPTDVWRIGSNAVALLGKSLSTVQRDLIVRHFAGRPIVIMLDSDARAEAHDIQGKLAAVRVSQPGDKRVLVAQLPAGGKDPAEFGREELAGIVRRCLGGPQQAEHRVMASV
jgi:hypothetical protein